MVFMPHLPPAKPSIRQTLREMPDGYYSARRYDTDDEMVLKIWLDNDPTSTASLSWDIRIPKPQNSVSPDNESQLAEAIQAQALASQKSWDTDRTGWTKEQWIEDAITLFNGPDGSVTSLLNGHVKYLIEEVEELQEALNNVDRDYGIPRLPSQRKKRHE